MEDIIDVVRLRIKILMKERGWDEKMLAKKQVYLCMLYMIF